MMRHRILVAEDEYWIRKSICELIEQVFEGEIAVLESENGEEALGVLANESVSVVLTDINMPFMDGLTLISKLNSQYPEIPVLVLSGYSDFPLVREALTGGALDYLLKPVKEAELRAAVEKALSEVDQRNRARESAARKQREEELYGDYIKDFIVSTFICQKESAASFCSNKKLEEYFSRISFPCYMTVIQRAGGRENTEDGQSVWERRYGRKKKIEEQLNEKDLWVIENAYRSNEYILLSSKGKEKLERCCLRLREMKDRDRSGALRICTSTELNSREQIPLVYKEIILKMISNAKYQKEFQYMSLGTEDISPDLPHGFSEELEEEVVQAFRRKDRAMLEYLLLDKLGIRRIEQDEWVLLEIRQAVSRFRSLIYSYYIRKMDLDEFWEVDNLCDSIEIAVLSGDTDEIVELFRQISGVLIHEDTGEENRERQMSDSVSGVLDYIRKHYTENITLSFLAEKFYLTPSYLSRSFKKQTGKNLVAFITEKRLEKAVEYIKSDEMSLTEAAFLVGYDDYTYFNKVFRRYMGVSPTQYREQCERSKNHTSE